VHVNKIKSAPTGHQCALHDWAFIHYVGWNDKGKEIVNSKKARHGHAAYYRIGHYEMSKCWDIAIQQMRQGEIANISCAGDVDKGGAPNQYEQDSTNIIPVYTDTKYKIEITECALVPLSFREDHGFGALDGVELEGERDFYM